MKGCRIFHGRSAGMYLKCSNWNYSTSASKPIAKANDLQYVSSSLGTTDDLSLQQEINGTQTTNIDGGGKRERNGLGKKINQRALPLSPLMDPLFHEAKNKYSASKPQPSKEERTPFQEQLAKNPYALALATPVRQCSATQLSLPSFFLQDFTLMSHPTTSEPWHVPRSLSSPSSSLKSSSEEEESSVHNPSLGSTSYVAMRQPLFQSFFKKGSGYTGIYKKFGIANAKSIARKQVTLQAVWRSDMDTFLLELMRRRTVELLEYLCSRDNLYIHKCASWERVEWSEQVGCVLWMGQKVISGEKQQGEEQEQEYEQEIPPGEFETKRIGPGGRKVVPVFNLRTMMGKHWVQKMREGNRIFGNQILVVKHKNATKEVQMRLWKLQGYVATYGGMSDEVNSGKVQRSKKANFKSIDITDFKPKGNFVAFGKRAR